MTIVGEDFHINGQPTYAGRVWHGQRIEGLLLNSRMVQATFDDRNTNTATRWGIRTRGAGTPNATRANSSPRCPTGGGMACWRSRSICRAVRPKGYSSAQPWENSAFNPDGSLRTNDIARLEPILDRADELGMVVILGCFYFGQDQRLTDEASVIRAVDNTTRWLLEHGWRNVLLEVDNECNVSF